MGYGLRAERWVSDFGIGFVLHFLFLYRAAPLMDKHIRPRIAERIEAPRDVQVQVPENWED